MSRRISLILAAASFVLCAVTILFWVRSLRRPDYAVTVGGALVGFIEIKAPDKGADPRRFADPHDKEQWAKLKSLPNLLYTDGNSFGLWRDGEIVGKIVHLEGDVETATIHPLLASPTTASFATTASEKKTSLKVAPPSICFSGRTSMPGWSMSMMK